MRPRISVILTGKGYTVTLERYHMYNIGDVLAVAGEMSANGRFEWEKPIFRVDVTEGEVDHLFYQLRASKWILPSDISIQEVQPKDEIPNRHILLIVKDVVS